MYAEFFGLKHEPFSIAPDPRYLFMSDRHREALAHLLYGLNGGGGFVLLTGEIGAGKTTVCRCFLEKIPKRCHVAYIFNPKLTAIELLKAICDEFGIEAPEGVASPSVSDYLRGINAFLLKTHAAGRNNVLIIDEAQNLSADVLEQLRLLTNLETNERKLLQIILIGQPELRDMLARPELEQLAQRIIARFHLEALSADETARYIRHRLMVGGLKRSMPFDRRARRRIHALTRGVPRRINLLCDRALLGAYANGQPKVDRSTVDRAAKEVFYRPPVLMHWLRGHWVWAVALLSLLLLMAGSGVMVGVRLAGQDGTGLPSATLRQGPETLAASALPSTLMASAPGAGPVAADEPGTYPFLTGDFSKIFSTIVRSEPEALRELALLWGLVVAAQDPCKMAERHGLSCYQGTTTLAQLRRMDRPVVLSLRDERNAPVHALLVGLNAQGATLRMGGQSQTVSLVSLAALWQGQFATLWRVPPGFTGRVQDGQAGLWVDDLAFRLARVLGEPEPPPSVFNGRLRSKIQTFQIGQGLTPDGIPGPTTFMQLNRVSGVDEPRLQNASLKLP